MVPALFVLPVQAQEAPEIRAVAAVTSAPLTAAPAPVPEGFVRIPATTPVVFDIVAPLSSKTSQIKEMFPIVLAVPIVVDGAELVPAGTPGEGQVVHAARSGWGGKAGELIIAARYLELNGVRIPLRKFSFGATGENRFGTAFAASVAVPVAGFFINGGEKTIQPGTRASAIVATDTDVPLPLPVVPAVAPEAPPAAEAAPPAAGDGTGSN